MVPAAVVLVKPGLRGPGKAGEALAEPRRWILGEGLCDERHLEEAGGYW